MEFQEGDILGYFQPKEDESQIVLYAQRESGPTNLRVKGNVDTAPITVTKLQEEGGNDYPLISLEISKYVISIFHLQIYFFLSYLLQVLLLNQSSHQLLL